MPGLSFTGRPGLVFPRALWLSGSAYESLYLPAILRLVLERRAILFKSINLHIQIYELSAAAVWHPGVPGIRAYPVSGRIRYPGVSAVIVKRAFYRRGIIGFPSPAPTSSPRALHQDS